MTAMAKKQESLSTSLLTQLHTSGAGYDILRYVSLPNLLGNEADTILYFMGKDLARRFNITSFEDIYDIADKMGDRKSTRLNSSHVAISYAVFCLKKKITQIAQHTIAEGTVETKYHGTKKKRL